MAATLFNSFHGLGDPSGYFHQITSGHDTSDVVFVDMLNHSSSSSRYHLNPPQEHPSLLESLYSFREESPDSYDLLTSFTYPDALSPSLRPSSFPLIDWSCWSDAGDSGAAWSSEETLYDTTPSEVEQENRLEVLKNTPWPGRCNHVTIDNHPGLILLESNPEEQEPSSRVSLGKKIRSLVKRLKK